MVKGGYRGLYFALPALLVLVAFVVYPLLSTVDLSFTNAKGGFVGLRNYVETLTSGTTRQASWNTLYYLGVSLIFELLLGIIAGVVLNQQFRGRELVRSIILVPWVIPEIVAATTWAWMFNSDFGIINHVLHSLGIISQPIGWLTNPHTVLPALTAIHVWKMFPLVAISVLAGLQAVPPELYEAARIDGAGFWQEVRYIMLPELRPVIASVTLLLMVTGLNSITIVYATTQGGPAGKSMLTSIEIYQEAFQYFDFNQASALSIVFFLVTACFISLYVWWTSSNAKA